MSDRSSFKVALLVIVYLICAYTAYQKFYGSGSTSNSMIRQPMIDKSVCRKFISNIDDKNEKKKCEKAVNQANKEAQVKCAQYFSQLKSCQSRSRAACRTQASNFESCVNAILTDAVKSEFQN